MSSLGLPQSWYNESDSSLALSIVSRLSKSCVPAAEAGGVSWKLCLMPPNYRHPSPVKQELIQTFKKKRTKPTPISSPWPCLALTSPIWPLMWRNCKFTWLCVMLAAAAAVKRVLILTFFVAPPPNPPPRSATRYRHYLRGQNLQIVFQGVAQFSNGLLGCCTIIFQDVAKFSDCLPRFCTIFRLSSKMLDNYLPRFFTKLPWSGNHDPPACCIDALTNIFMSMITISIELWFLQCVTKSPVVGLFQCKWEVHWEQLGGTHTNQPSSSN